MSDLYELIYVSALANDAHPGCVSDIIRTSRANNSWREITGVLIFDGARFCQYLEGLPSEVLALAERIKTDPRHVEFSIKHHGALSADARRFPGWSMAYALDDSGETLEQFLSTQGQASTLLLEQRMPYLDGDFSVKP